MNVFPRSMILLVAGLAGLLSGCGRSAPSPGRPSGFSANATFDVESGPHAAGKKVMAASGCFRCHTINTLRGPVGDDLVASAPANSGDRSPPPDAPGGGDEGEDDGDESSGNFRLGDFLAKPLIQLLDRDKDGKLTKDEWVEGVKQFFKNQDKEKTGMLAQKEISDGLTAIIPTPRGFWGSGGQRFGLGELFAPDVVRRADTNKDGKVTEPELVAAAESIFQEYDRDKLGKLGEKEIAKAINQVGNSSLTPGAASRGPDLGTVGQKPGHTIDWFKAQIRQPKSHKKNARMPSFEGKIKDDDLNALAEYLASLK